MIPKKPAPDLIRGGHRFSEKIMLNRKVERDDDSKKSDPALRDTNVGTRMLDLENVNAYYGDSHILHGVSLTVKEGEVVCLLGRNGAGKTTTILTIMGYLKPRPGRIRFRDRDIAALPPYAVARLGFGFVPQERGIFPSLSVRENLTVFARGGGQGRDNRRWTLEKIF